MTDQRGLDNALLYGTFVIGMDQSYKNLVDSNLQITVICTFDPTARQVLLVALFLSIDAKTETLVKATSKLDELINNRAKHLVTVPVDRWPPKLGSRSECIRKVSEDGFCPEYLTTDLAANNHACIAKVWPNTKGRSCFWHLENAILGWKWDLMDKRMMQPPKELRASLLAQFTKVCRARTKEDNEQLSKEFLETGIPSSVKKHCSTLSEKQQKDLTDVIVDTFRHHWIECELSET